jgi:hypothetical protein
MENRAIDQTATTKRINLMHSTPLPSPCYASNRSRNSRITNAPHDAFHRR